MKKSVEHASTTSIENHKGKREKCVVKGTVNHKDIANEAKSKHSGNDDSAGKESNDGFRYSNHYQKKIARKEKRKFTKGSRESVVGSFSGPPPTKTIFIYKVSEGNENSIKEYLTKNGVTVREIVKMSHKDSRLKSFKVSVAPENVGLLLDENNILPKGVCAQWFDYKRKSRNNNN